MSLGHFALDTCEVVGDHENLTSTRLTCSCISSDLMKILTMPTHDLRDTRDNRVKAHSPQPIGFAVLRLTCSSAGSVASSRGELGAIASGMLEILMNEKHAD